MASLFLLPPSLVRPTESKHGEGIGAWLHGTTSGWITGCGPGTVHHCGPEEDRQSFQAHHWCVLCWLVGCLWVEVIAEWPTAMIYTWFVSTKLIVKFDWGGTFGSWVECQEVLVPFFPFFWDCRSFHKSTRYSCVHPPFCIPLCSETSREPHQKLWRCPCHARGLPRLLNLPGTQVNSFFVLYNSLILSYPVRTTENRLKHHWTAQKAAPTWWGGC